MAVSGRGAQLKSAVTNYCSNFWSINNAKRKFPIVTWLPNYRMKHFFGDLVAGLTVGLTVLPQGLAYALVAELPAQYGLYSAFMGCFIYAFFGTSKDVTLGPTAIMSIMTAEFSKNPIEHDPTYAILLCFLCGVIQFFMGMVHLGFIVQFISYPVINAFTSAAALTIASGQIRKWLGLTSVTRRDWPGLIYQTFGAIPETKLPDFGMGLCCIIVLVLMKMVKEFSDKRMKIVDQPTWKKVLYRILWLVCTARNAVIVMITAVIAYILQTNGIQTPALTGTIKSGLPPLRLPSFSVIYNGTVIQGPAEVFKNLGAGIAVIPLVGLLENIAIAKAFSRRNDYRIDADQELIAIGLANLVSCFVGSYPVTGSFSRTAINSQSGVRTPLGGIWTGGLVLLALAFLTPFFQYIPQAALAAVIITAVLQMVDYQILITLWRVKPVDLIPYFLTFIFSFALGLEFGIGIGVGFNLLLLLYPLARPKISNSYEKSHDYLPLTHDVDPDIEEKDRQSRMAEVVVMEPDKGLNYPGIEYLKDKVMKQALLENGELRSVVLNCLHITGLDYTTVAGVTELCEYFTKRKINIVYANLTPDVLSILQSAKIKDFVFTETVDEAIRTALGGDVHEMVQDTSDIERKPSSSHSEKEVKDADRKSSQGSLKSSSKRSSQKSSQRSSQKSGQDNKSFEAPRDGLGPSASASELSTSGSKSPLV